MFGQGQSAGSGDDRRYPDVACDGEAFLDQVLEGLANIGKMALIVREEEMIFLIQEGDFDGGGTDVDSKFAEFLVSHCYSFVSL